MPQQFCWYCRCYISSKLGYVAMLRALASFELGSFPSCFHFCAKAHEIVSFQTPLHMFISSQDTFLEPTWWSELDNSDQYLSHKFWSFLWSLNSLSYPSPFLLPAVKCSSQSTSDSYVQSCLQYETHLQGWVATKVDGTVKKGRETEISVFDFN